jgi:hypothetical protein
MIKKNTAWLLFWLLASAAGFAQTSLSFYPAKKISGTFTSFAVDHLENIYLLTATDQLKKIDAKGDSVAVFNNIRGYGKVSLIDVSNPLRLLLYYKDFSTAVILDRLLNIRSTIDLRRQNIFQVQAIGLSYDNKLWLYDELEHKLKKIDEDGKLLLETPDFRQLFNEAYSFTSLTDQDGFLYLHDLEKGVLVFDYYGSFKKKILINGIKNFKVSGKFFYGVRHDSLIRYQPDSFRMEQFPLPDGLRKAISIKIMGNRVYTLKDEGLEVYEIK